MTPNLPNITTCCGCSACRSVCPNGAIAMKADEEGFLQPVIDSSKCIHCGKCESVCPVLHHGKPRKPIAVYAAKAKDDKLRVGSASGGIFTLLAQDTLRRGGVVFGAGFDHCDWRVIHKAAHNEAELDDLRGSKYVQSDVDSTYLEAKQLLDAGREVLYSGCPCQIAALLNFLGKPYSNLTTVDLVCHGVPSPLAWRKYLDDREREAGAKISRILARRYCAWQEFAISLEFDNSREIAYCQNADKDTFMLSFGRWWTLRECCYSCQFKSFRNGADLSLGDYNGRFLNNKEFCDSLGISILCANTKKGIGAIRRIENDFSELRTTLSDIRRHNLCVAHSTIRSRLRSKFYTVLKTECGFDAAVKKMFSLRDGSLFWHLLWWCKRFVVNHEVNNIQWT